MKNAKILKGDVIVPVKKDMLEIVEDIKSNVRGISGTW